MSVEFIGYVGHFNSSETMKREGPAIDVDHIEAMAKAQEYVGFDRVLVAFNSTSAESILIAQHVANVTQRLKLMIAHRPGFTAPTLAARQLATLDQISRGRVAVHIITGGNDIELAQDGDHLTKDERYARTSEYLDIVRQEWTSATPFDYQRKLLPRRSRVRRHQAVQRVGHPGLFRRCFRCRHRGGRQARRCLRVVGRNVRAGPRTGQPRAGRCRSVRPHAQVQPVAAAGPGGYRGAGLGEGRSDRGPSRRTA